MLTCNGSKTFQTFIKAVTDLIDSNLLEDQIVCAIEKLLEELLEKNMASARKTEGEFGSICTALVI